jgi:IS5 family transposase
LGDVKFFIDHQQIKEGKLLSFHAEEVKCISKGKLGVPFEFGRVYQMYRCGGNYLGIVPPETVGENDREAVKSVIDCHQETFGKGVLKSISADKGYYSDKNFQAAENEKVEEIGIQVYTKSKKKMNNEKEEELYNRRAGIEALIGCAKNKYGFGQSKMKSDKSTVMAALRSVMGFNLNQMIKDKVKKIKNNKMPLAA